MKKSFFAGSFDPFTNGHTDIIKQASLDFDEIVVGIGINENKHRKYSALIMKYLIESILKSENIKGKVVIYSGMTAEEARKNDCQVLIRGYRNDKDIAYEKEIADFNKTNYNIETKLYEAKTGGENISSSKVKELLINGENISDYVNKEVMNYLLAKKQIIGVSGKSGSGKSCIAKALAGKLGVAYLDVDAIGHDSLKNSVVKQDLLDCFGDKILNNELEIDRKILGSIVFNSKNAMDKLKSITWHYMEKEILKFIIANNYKVIIDYALLPITSIWDFVDYKIYVDASLETRKNRVLQRDEICEKSFIERDKNACDYSNFEFDYTLINEGNIDDEINAILLFLIIN